MIKLKLTRSIVAVHSSRFHAYSGLMFFTVVQDDCVSHAFLMRMLALCATEDILNFPSGGIPLESLYPKLFLSGPLQLTMRAAFSQRILLILYFAPLAWNHITSLAPLACLGLRLPVLHSIFPVLPLDSPCNCSHPLHTTFS